MPRSTITLRTTEYFIAYFKLSLMEREPSKPEDAISERARVQIEIFEANESKNVYKSSYKCLEAMRNLGLFCLYFLCIHIAA